MTFTQEKNAKNDKPCLFCKWAELLDKLERREMDEEKLEKEDKKWYNYQYLRKSKHFFAVLDRYPRIEGDTLIISRKHHPHCTDIADPSLREFQLEAKEDFFNFMIKIVSALKKLTKDEKHPKIYMMSMCEHWEPEEIALAGGKFSTEHLHFHLLPRHKDMRLTKYPYFVPEHMFIRCQNQNCKWKELKTTKEKILESLETPR